MEEILFKGMIKRSGEWSEKAALLYDIKQQIKALSVIEAELRDELIELSENQPSYDEHGMIFRSYETKGGIDYTKIPQLHNVNLEPYRKESYTCWKITVTK